MKLYYFLPLLLLPLTMFIYYQYTTQYIFGAQIPHNQQLQNYSNNTYDNYIFVCKPMFKCNIFIQDTNYTGVLKNFKHAKSIYNEIVQNGGTVLSKDEILKYEKNKKKFKFIKP